MLNKILCLFLVLGLVISFTGCPKRIRRPKPVEKVEEPVSKEEPDIRVGGEFTSIPELENINFNYNKFEILPEARTILKSNAGFLKENPEYEVLVEGHCCECGTNEYNLALGQKRASSVRDYYTRLGIAAGDIGTISYGEEKQINVNAGPPDSPQCRANRRAETKVRMKPKE